MFRLSIFIIISSVAAASLAICAPQNQLNPAPMPQKSQPQEEDDRIVITDEDSAKSISRRDFMRTKLMFSENIFEGLTTADFDAIENSVKEVQMITEGEQWVAIDNDQYRKLTEEFKTTTKRLMQAAKTQNIDATALRYYAMATSCIDCHKHIRKAGYEF